MIRFILLLFTIFILFFSCTNTQARLENYVKNIGNKDTITLKDVIREDWSIVLIVNQSVSLEELNEYLGFDYPFFEDVGQKIVFLKDGKIIYYENYFPYYGYNKKTICFNINDSIKFSEFNKENAVFVVEKSNYYILSPISDNVPN